MTAHAFKTDSGRWFVQTDGPFYTRGHGFTLEEAVAAAGALSRLRPGEELELVVEVA